MGTNAVDSGNGIGPAPASSPPPPTVVDWTIAEAQTLLSNGFTIVFWIAPPMIFVQRVALHVLWSSSAPVTPSKDQRNVDGAGGSTQYPSTRLAPGTATRWVGACGIDDPPLLAPVSATDTWLSVAPSRTTTCTVVPLN